MFASSTLKIQVAFIVLAHPWAHSHLLCVGTHSPVPVPPASPEAQLPWWPQMAACELSLHSHRESRGPLSKARSQTHSTGVCSRTLPGCRGAPRGPGEGSAEAWDTGHLLMMESVHPARSPGCPAGAAWGAWWLRTTSIEIRLEGTELQCLCLPDPGVAFFTPRRHGEGWAGEARLGMEPLRSCHCSGQLAWGRVPGNPRLQPAFFSI